MLKIFRYLKSMKWAMVGAFSLIFIRTLTDLLLPTLMGDIVNKGVVRGNLNFILSTGLWMLGITILGGIAAVAGSYLSARIGMRFGQLVRGDLFKKISHFSLHEMDRFGTASLMTRNTNDVTQVQNVALMLFRMFSRAPLMALGSLLLALQKDVPLTGVILIGVVVMGVFIGLIASGLFPLFRKRQTQVDRLNRVLRERLSGIRVIRAFNRSEHEEKRFDVENVELTSLALTINRWMALLMPLIFFVFNITTLAVMWFGGIRIQDNAMQIGDLIAFIQYAMQIMFAVMMITMIFVIVPRAQVSAERINEVLDVETEIKDDQDKNLQAKSRHSVVSKEGYVSFEKVGFWYASDREASDPALSDLSFECKAGQVTAILGGTGAGKSTLVNLIPRFYEVHEGGIQVDGRDIRDYSLKDLRSRIAFVPQKNILFSGSVAENIRYGRPNATDEEVRRAAEIAQASEFIEPLSQGYETLVEQGGKNFSGGQKQRLAIARALVKKAPILILDDSFSALDFKTESKLRQALMREVEDLTMIFVAQRIASVMTADQILVLDQGRLVGSGTHADLMQECPVYREIAYSQLSKQELESMNAKKEARQ